MGDKVQLFSCATVPVLSVNITAQAGRIIDNLRKPQIKAASHYLQNEYNGTNSNDNQMDEHG